MLDVLEPSLKVAGSSPTAPMQIGLVILNVKDVTTVGDYYRRLLGLEITGRDGSTAQLGAAGQPLLELRHNPALTPRNPRSAGLFHTAFLMPSRGDLGAWVRYIARERIPVAGASDHAVSEAIYLTDPEGNGIEVYADRPRDSWPVSDNGIEMTTEALDAPSLMAEDPSQAWRGAPAGMIVGHMHLQAGQLAEAEAFYHGVLGLDVTCRYSGAVFYGAGGYHHQLATNVWNSRGAGRIAPDTTGLVGFEIILDTPAQLQAIEQRAADAKAALLTEGNFATATDPWSLAITLKTC